MKIVVLILAILLMTSCKTKRVINDSEIQKEVLKVNLKKDSIQNESKIQEKKVDSEKKSADQKKESQTEIDIIGKAEIDKPLEVFHVENGDTLQAIKVTGNAEVRIRTKAFKSENLKTESNSESLIEKFKQFSENIVEENRVAERIAEAKKKSKDATVRTGTFWSFGLIGGLGAFALFLIAIFIYFKNYRKND